MTSEGANQRRRFAGLGVLPALFWAAAFAAANGQPPLYFSNQNQYFLHGLAAAGRGDLAHDWLANTLDSTPVFSVGIAWIYSHVGEWGFYAAYAILQGVYFVSLVALIDATLGLPRGRPARFVLLALLVAIGGCAARWASVYISGTLVPMYLHRQNDLVDVPRYLQQGLASQYLLAQGLQPSAFGVLLLASMACFARGRPIVAALLGAAGCAVHATYLLPAAMLTAMYMLVLVRNGRWLMALLVGAITLLAVTPLVLNIHAEFAPTTPEQAAEAQRLMVDVRLPHHAVATHWWDRGGKLQVAWFLFGVLLTVRTRLFPLLAIPALLATLLTLARTASESPAVMEWLLARGFTAETLERFTIWSRTLALLFPWRISAVLIPVATAVIVTRLVAMLTPYPGRPEWLGWGARLVGAVVFVAAVGGGLYITLREPGRIWPTDDRELPTLAFVERHRKPGDVYLIPPDELERFRLSTGAPVYADWKSIPYKDVEVLTWYQRVERARKWYSGGDWDAAHDELRREGITHVVIPAGNAPAGAMKLEREFDDEAHAVYRVRD
jgi:hypothetical protein